MNQAESPLTSIETMLVRAAISLTQDSGRHEGHQILFTVLTELLPLDTIISNIQEVIQNLNKGLQAQNPQIQENSLEIINTLLKTNYKLHDIPDILLGDQ